MGQKNCIAQLFIQEICFSGDLLAFHLSFHEQPIQVNNKCIFCMRKGKSWQKNCFDLKYFIPLEAYPHPQESIIKKRVQQKWFNFGISHHGHGDNNYNIFGHMSDLSRVTRHMSLIDWNFRITYEIYFKIVVCFTQFHPNPRDDIFDNRAYFLTGATTIKFYFDFAS